MVRAPREARSSSRPAGAVAARHTGCKALTAAKIVGETLGHSRSAYARWNGTAPQPAWSGNTRRFRLSRGGNRQVNSALHRIAITQARNASAGRAYRRIKQGNSRTEALRLLRCRLWDVVYRTLLLEEPHRAPPLDKQPSLTENNKDFGKTDLT